MGKWFGIAMSLVMVLTLSACSQPGTSDDTTKPEGNGMTAPSDEAAAPAPMDTPAEPMAAPEPAPAAPDVTPAEPAMPADPAAEPPAMDGAAAPASNDQAKVGLVGPQWKYEEYIATFNDDNTVTIKMGELAMAGQYTLKDDGALEINAMGNMLNGTWDGTTLSINGSALEKIQ